MAIAFRSAATGKFDNTASPVVTAPAGLTNGDLVILVLATNGTETVNTVLAGWTQAGAEQNQSTDSTLMVFYKIASGEGASWTFADLFDAAEYGVYGVVAYSGVDSSTPLDVAVVQGDLLNVGTGGSDTGSITPTSANCMVVSMFGADPAVNTRTGTVDSSPACTERVDTTEGTTQGWVYVQDHVQGSAAAEAHTVTPNETEGIAYMIMALRPAIAGGLSIPVAMATYRKRRR